MEKFRSCQIVQKDVGVDFIPGCAFNEWVLVRLLETDYLDKLTVRGSYLIYASGPLALIMM